MSHLGDLKPVTAIFYGVSPAVIALILHSCYRLAKLGMEDWLQWAIAGVCFLVTVVLQAEVALLVHRLGPRRRRVVWRRLPLAALADDLAVAAPLAAGVARPRPRARLRQAPAVLPQGGLADLRQRACHRAFPRTGSRPAIRLARSSANF